MAFGYLLVAVLCSLAALSRGTGRRLERLPISRSWLILALLLLVLGVNRWFDLATEIADLGRQVARDQNWYQRRRLFQAISIAVITTVGLIILSQAGKLTRATSQGLTRAVSGLVVLVTFATVRALSLHSVDWLLSRRVAGFSVNAALEFSGLAWVAFSAFESLRETQAAGGKPRHNKSTAGG